MDIRSFLALARERGNIAALVTSGLLIGYICFLLITYYLSQRDLHNYTLEQMRHDTEKCAIAISYFCSEQKNELKNLTASRGISAYFENKALGMSMEYGLRASLVIISEIFDRILEERRLEGDRIYTRIVFVTSSGNLLVDEHREGSKKAHVQDWKKSLSPGSGVAIHVTHEGGLLRIMVSAPCFFKNEYIGQIIAWVLPQTIYHLLGAEKESSKRSVYLVCGKDYFPLPKDVQSRTSFSDLPNLENLEIGKTHLLEAIRKDGSKVDMIGIQVPVKDTPLSLTTFFPTSEIFGRMAPWHLLLAMGIIAILIISGTIIAFRINTQKLVLQAKLAEASKREQEIEEKNSLIEKEITERRRIQDSLRRARDELERRVNERTADLAKANEKLQSEITDRMRAEEELKGYADELKRSNQELQQFVYIASHDLQEPLRMVASYTQLLGRRYKGKLDSDADDFIAYAVDGATRMKALINGLLTYSRVGTKGKDFEPADCEAVLRSTLDNLQKAIEESGAKITYDPLPTVMADDMQLGQLFQNLIGNATKFRSEEHPSIHVSCERIEESAIGNRQSVMNKGWVFSVRDNGIGIDPEFTGRIFIIFQRLHKRGEYPGSGIGLAICKKIVERHGGRIWVESDPGKGSTFYFTIPLRGENSHG